MGERSEPRTLREALRTDEKKNGERSSENRVEHCCGCCFSAESVSKYGNYFSCGNKSMRIGCESVGKKKAMRKYVQFWICVGFQRRHHCSTLREGDRGERFGGSACKMRLDLR